MSKKMTFRKKGLAVILCLMMGIATIAGCGKQEETPVVEDDEDALEVPEVKGKEEEVGAFTLLVPKGMDAEEGSSESVVTLSEDDDTNIVFQVVEKGDAKDYVKALIEEDDSFKEISFSLDGTKWTGAAYKKDFVVYAKIGKKTVLVIGTGYKYTDDIPLAVLASLEVDDDAEEVAVSGAGKGGTFVYGNGLYTVEYSGAYREADPSSEFGDLVTTDGKQRIYVESLEDWDDYSYTVGNIMNNTYYAEDISIGEWTGTLYTYYDSYWGEYKADFIVPFDYIYSNSYGEMMAVYIHTEASTEEEAATDDFRELIRSVEVDPSNCTDDPSEPVYDPVVDTEEHFGEVGDTMSTAWFDFVVTNAYCFDSFDGYYPSDGNVYVAVEMELTNTYFDDVEMYNDDFILFYDYGDYDYTYPISYTIADDQFSISGYTLGYGEEMTGYYIFEVPEGYDSFELGFEEYFTDDSYGDTFYVDFTAEKVTV